MNFEPRKRLQIHLNVTPLIDIVFLLLIFFMLTANFIMQPGLKIDLPDTKSLSLHEQQRVNIVITKENQIFVNESEASMESLKGVLEAELAKAEKNTVVLKADESIKFGPAVQAMDIIKELEIDGLVISTEISNDEK